jgi:hypothetical protein
VPGNSEEEDANHFLFTVSSIISVIPFLSWLVRLSDSLLLVRDSLVKSLP